MICKQKGFTCKCHRTEKCDPGPIDFKATPNIQVFKQEFWDTLDKDPVFIRSKNHLKEECDKRGLIATGYM